MGSGVAEPRFNRADPTAQPTGGDAAIVQCVVAPGVAVAKLPRNAISLAPPTRRTCAGLDFT